MRTDLLAAARVAGLATTLVALVAAGVRLALVQDARDWLGFTFPGLPHRMSEAVDIFVNNGTLLTGVLVACVVVGAALPEPGARRTERIALRLAVAVFDLVLLLVATFHVVYVGAAVGAYGGRTVEAMLPHGPVELGAFALALAQYLAARRERLSRQRIAVTALVSFAGLAVAALLEVFV